jgi:hypothetical protein
MRGSRSLLWLLFNRPASHQPGNKAFVGCFAMNRLATSAVCAMSLLVFSIGPALSQHTANTFSCDDDYSLKLSQSSDGEEHASWGRHGYCLFRDGKRIPNRIALWSDPKVYDTGIWIYRGMGNVCSQSQLLIFDEHQEILRLVDMAGTGIHIYHCKSIDQ